MLRDKLEETVKRSLLGSVWHFTDPNRLCIVNKVTVSPTGIWLDADFSDGGSTYFHILHLARRVIDD